MDPKNRDEIKARLQKLGALDFFYDALNHVALCYVVGPMKFDIPNKLTDLQIVSKIKEKGIDIKLDETQKELYIEISYPDSNTAIRNKATTEDLLILMAFANEEKEVTGPNWVKINVNDRRGRLEELLGINIIDQ